MSNLLRVVCNPRAGGRPAPMWGLAMRYLLQASILAFTLIAAAGSAHADDDFRCSGRIVKAGMTDAAVLQACGAPESRQSETQDVRSGNRVVGKTVIWRWTYTIAGRTRVLVFDQGTLKSIE